MNIFLIILMIFKKVVSDNIASSEQITYIINNNIEYK
jgi:hypothetical protein